MENLNIAVIGCGVISENHLYAIERLKGLRLVAVCDIDEEKAIKTAVKYNTSYYTDYKEMAEKEKLDGVHICLPHYLHKEVAVYFLERGVSVLCEKPMALNMNEAQQMADTSEKCSTKLDVVFQNRLNSASKLIFETIKSGKLGQTKRIYAQLKWKRDREYYNNGQWRGVMTQSGGGTLINQAIHTLDMSRMMADSEVEDVSAQVRNLQHDYIDVEDVVDAVIKFENGTVLTVLFTNNNTENEPICVHALCEKGTIDLKGADAVITLNDGTVIKNEIDKDTFYGAKKVYGTGHIKQIERFYFGNEEEIKASMNEALKTQSLIDKIYESRG